MNKAIIIGRLTRDPEMRTTASGINSTSFTVAVSRNYANQNGEREADFINIVVWRAAADNCYKYLKKGSKAGVVGSMQTRSYDAQDGTKRYVTEIIADNVTFLGGKGATASDNNFVGGGNDIVTTDISEDPFKDFASEVALSDDDLPF